VIEHMKSSSGDTPPRWSLVTNHGHVLACIAADPNTRLRDIADAVGITERTAAQIVSELEQAGYLTKTRVGRRNRYRIDGKRKIRMAGATTMTVAQLVGVLLQALEQQPFA
jgi:DNA-binding IclR family transcriptional regulator